MKNVRYLLVGIAFGLVLTKAEAISWFRIQEMFRFESFHMFGIFMTAVPVGALSLLLIRRFKLKTFGGEGVVMPEKKFHKGIIAGGLIFGCGWALTGACPGPLYAQIGAGYATAAVSLAAALAGTWCCGYFEKFFPN